MAKAKMIVLSVDDRPGAVAKAVAALAEAKIGLHSVLGWAPQGILQLVVDNPTAATGVMEKLGIPWSEEQAEVVELTNEPGALHNYLKDLAGQGVNLRSLCGFGSPDSHKSYVVWTAEK